MFLMKQIVFILYKEYKFKKIEMKKIKKVVNKTRKPRRSSIAVTQLKKSGKRVRSYNSLCEASDKTGVNVGSISKAVRGITNSAGGFCWVEKIK